MAVTGVSLERRTAGYVWWGHTGQDVLEREVDVGGLEGGCLDERKAVLA